MPRNEPKKAAGPKPERLRIDARWDDAVKKALHGQPSRDDSKGTADRRYQVRDENGDCRIVTVIPLENGGESRSRLVDGGSISSVLVRDVNDPSKRFLAAIDDLQPI